MKLAASLFTEAMIYALQDKVENLERDKTELKEKQARVQLDEAIKVIEWYKENCPNDANIKGKFPANEFLEKVKK